MQKFVVLFSQVGEGCDYSIDCGKTFAFFEAENMQEAIKMVLADDDSSEFGIDDMSIAYYGDDRIEEALIIPVNGMVDAIKELNKAKDLAKIAKAKRQEIERKEVAKLEAIEREKKDQEEYERLKKKYNGNP